MNQFLFPSGEIDFQGNMEQLLHVIRKLDGTLMADQQFRCSVPYPMPKRKGLNLLIIYRHMLLLSWQFRCKYEVTEFGFRISYRGSPSFLEVLLLFVPFAAAFADYSKISIQNTIPYRLLAALLFSVVFYPIFFIVQKRCILHFQSTFRD